MKLYAIDDNTPCIECECCGSVSDVTDFCVYAAVFPKRTGPTTFALDKQSIQFEAFAGSDDGWPMIGCPVCEGSFPCEDFLDYIEEED